MRDPRLDIAARRLRNQRLTGDPLGEPAEVVRWLGGLQAQEYPVARWSIGLRARGLTEGDVDAALGRGEILRTHVLRDTWHLVAAEDVRWLVALTGPRIQARNATMYRRLGLDPATLAAAEAVIVDALGEHGELTRKQIGAALRERGIEADRLRLGYVLMHAELELLVASGALQGKQQTYALLEGRVPAGPRPSRDEALAELARRYFMSHGPATLKDLTWWASLTMRDARRAVELLGDELEGMDVDGRTYWSRPGPAPRASRAHRVHLLQGYDEYVIAYSESRDVLNVRGLTGGVPFTHALLVDGQFAGHWRRRITSRQVTIDVHLARPVAEREQRVIDDAVAAYGQFVGLPASRSG